MTTVLHFKVKKYTVKTYKWEEKVPKNAQFSFSGQRKGFSLQNCPSRNSTFSSRWSAWPTLKRNEPAKFLKLNTHLHTVILH